MKKTLVSAFSAVVLSAGCVGGESPVEPTVDGSLEQSSSGKADNGKPTLYRCWSSPKSFSTSNKFRHTKSKLANLLGSAHHRAQDIVATPGSLVTIDTVLAVGDTDKALEDERVQLYFDNCATTVKLTDRLTNDDGHAKIQIRLPSVPGVFALHIVADGDGRSGTAYAWVLPKGTHFAVSDIDGTLTTGDEEIFKSTIADLFGANYDPDAYEAASDLTWSQVTRGRIPLYLTGRPNAFKTDTSNWLWGHYMAFGPVRVTDKSSQVLPGNSGVGAFKRDYLKSLQAQGYYLDAAFGNASTDIYAYEQVGIPKDETYIIGPNAGDSGTVPVDGAWTDVATSESAAPVVAQPFTW